MPNAEGGTMLSPLRMIDSILEMGGIAELCGRPQWPQYFVRPSVR